MKAEFEAGFREVCKEVEAYAKGGKNGKGVGIGQGSGSGSVGEKKMLSEGDGSKRDIGEMDEVMRLLEREREMQRKC